MAARVAAIALLASLSQAFSLVSFPFTNLFLTLSLSLSRFTEVQNCWKETDRNHRISCV